MRKKTASTLMAAAVIAAPAALAQSADAGVIGLADNKPIAYENNEINALGLRYARISVRYDAYRYASTRKKFLALYGAAIRNGYRPVVVFSGSSRGVPTPTRVAAAVRGFSRLRVSSRGVPSFTRSYTRPREFSLYNEPNYQGYFKNRPAKLGEAYVRARRANRKATILAGDLLDTTTGSSRYRVGTYARAVERGARSYSRGSVRTIPLWGLHNYNDINKQLRYSKSGTRQMLSAVRGKVWLTETGGVVSKPKSNRSGQVARFKGEGVSHAFRANQRLFSKDYLGRSSVKKRIPRTYIYQGIGGARGEWDSGLIGADGSQRTQSIALIAGKRGKY